MAQVGPWLYKVIGKLITLHVCLEVLSFPMGHCKCL
jgi:hypothetical protein